MEGNESTTNPMPTITPRVPVTWDTVVLGIVLFALVTITILGNALVLIAVYIEKRLQTSFNYYIVNLAVTDVAVAVTAMTFYSIHNILGYWPFGQFMCAVWIFFDYGMTFVSVFTLLLISVDRFWSVTWLAHYRRYHNKRTCFVSIAFVWCLMLMLWLPPCISDRILNSVTGECKWEPSLNREFVIVIAAIGHHGSCAVMLFCYIRVFLVMHKQKRVIADSATSSAPSETPSAGSNSQTVNNPDVNPRLDIPSQDELTTAYGPLGVHPSESVTVHQTLKVPGQNESTEKNNANQFKHRSNRQKRERKVFVTLTYILVAYVICWVPFHFVFDISSVDASLVPETIYSITFWLTYINSTVNPFLYNFSCADFRDTFSRIVWKRLKCC